MSRTVIYSRPKTAPEETLLQFLERKFSYLTKEQWQAHLAAGYLSVNEAVLHRGDEILKQHDVVTFSPPRSLEPPVDEVHLTIVHEDDDIVVCAKSGDLPVAEGGRYCQNTLVGVLNRRAAAAGGVRRSTGEQEKDGGDASRKRRREGDGAARKRSSKQRPGETLYLPVHRLDKETSGLVVLAKSSRTADTLRIDFEAQSRILSDDTPLPFHTPLAPEQVEALLATKTGVRKRYVALLAGAAPEGKVFVVHNRIGPVGEHPTEREMPEHQKLSRLKMMCVPLTLDDSSPSPLRHFGKPALSLITIVRSDPVLRLSLAEVDILTGRSHQIRLHCAHVGFPVLGDKLYTTSTPGAEGQGHPVDDDMYLARVRTMDPVTGHTAFAADSVCPQWLCRRHCLHAAQLCFDHPVDTDQDGAKRPLSFSEPATEWFLRDVRPAAEDNAASLSALQNLLRSCWL